MTARPLDHRPSLRAFGRSVVETARLAAARRLASPRTHLTCRLDFADGTTSVVFRETAVRGEVTVAPTVLVVQFRLRAIGRSRLLHAMFRRECILHTPLFAGFPGFRSKLWLADPRTGGYRGLYQWDGADQAVSYAETLIGLLRPLSVDDSVDFHVEHGLCRDDLLRQGDRVPGAGEWWRPRGPIRPALTGTG